MGRMSKVTKVVEEVVERVVAAPATQEVLGAALVASDALQAQKNAITEAPAAEAPAPDYKQVGQVEMQGTAAFGVTVTMGRVIFATAMRQIVQRTLKPGGRVRVTVEAEVAE